MDEVGKTRRKKNKGSISIRAVIISGGKEKILYKQHLRHLQQTKDKCRHPKEESRRDLVKDLNKWQK